MIGPRQEQCGEDALWPGQWPASVNPPAPGERSAVFVHVPKTGGTAICEMFGPWILTRHHRPAVDVPELADAPWSFAFVRNPWDRMLSWFYWSEPQSVLARAGRAWFSTWVLERGQETFRTCEALLTDGYDEEPLVDAVFQFEHFDLEVARISARLGARVRPVVANENPSKPPGLDYRPLYTPAARDAVARLGAWEIEHFGYEY